MTTKPYGDAFAEEILTRVARLAWAEYRESFAGYVLARHGHGSADATGAHGDVVDLAARRKSA